MDDRETELSRFRQQWKEEVTARTRPGATAQHASSSKAKAPAPAFSARKLSHSSTSANDAPEEEEAPAPLPVRERSTSPTAVRRPSVSVPSAPGVPESALEHYEKAVEKETQGSLGESLSLYRKAFRMDAKVDSHYREKYFPRPPASAGPSTTPKGKHPASPTPPAPPAPNPAHSPAAPPPASLASNSKEISALIVSFAHLHIPPTLPPQLEGEAPPPEPVFSPLATLPHELLLHTLRNLALTDVASFARCALVCKALAYTAITEQSIWRDICTATYSRMLWDWNCSVDGAPLPPPSSPEPSEGTEEEDLEEEGEKRVIPLDEDLLANYAGNWRKMFHSRPRVRFNGVYISTCNYVRSGASQSGWNTPVHIVTYYRYLRFYPDGTVLSLLTTTEPGEVVGGFSKTALTPAHLRDAAAGVTGVVGQWGRYVCRGRWRLDPEGRVDVETEPGGTMDRYLFRMQMRVKSVRAGGRWSGCNKLVWEGFWSWNRLTDDLAEFSLRNDKAFFFSRVGAIEREMGIV